MARRCIIALSVVLLGAIGCKNEPSEYLYQTQDLSYIPEDKYGIPIIPKEEREQKERKIKKPTKREEKRPETRISRGGILYAKCDTRIMTVKFCSTNVTYSDTIQHRSKIKVINLKNGRSIRLIVNWRKGVEGLCIPRKYKSFISPSSPHFKAKVIVLRCGENGVKTCPAGFIGRASWYGPGFHGRPMASGFIFDSHKFVAAHRWLPFGTVLLVENMKNGKKVKVTVWDRGPFIKGRHLDLSYGAAKAIDMINDGVVPVKAVVLKCGT